MILIPVAHAEVVDKLTILQIKRERIRDKKQLQKVREEWDALHPLLAKLDMTTNHELYRKLLEVNRKFWDYHDWQRSRWRNAGDKVDEELYWRSRDEHRLNDKRARIKLEINRVTKSEIVEQKQFPIYTIG